MGSDAKTQGVEASSASAGAVRCEGEGLSAAIVRQPNIFQVLATDAASTDKPVGPDDVLVHIRGSGVHLRAKVADNGDGSLTVTYTPETTGEYHIDVSVHGEKPPGSPFTCIASTRTPHALHCTITGEGLTKAVSREQQSVEVRFRDALGTVAHAEDIDCYAEPVDEDTFLSLLGEEDELGLPDWLRAGQPASPRPLSPPMRPLPDAVNAAKARVPLVVRLEESTTSDRVCQLPRGRMLYVLEERPETVDGCVRALVAVEDVDGEEEQWRQFYESGSPPARSRQRARSPQSPRHSPVGWVTIHKEGKSLVTPQRQLAAGERQQHMVAWERRKAVDKTMALGSTAKAMAKDGTAKKNAVGLSTRWKLGAFWNEVTSDPLGVGFAFGGVEPGRLRAKGKCVEVHKLYYSIGRAGKYKLHIGLRHQMTPLPGSPFHLEVTPGPASAITTMLPKDLELRGEVGWSEDNGCSLTLQSYDFTGNRCVEGAARVTCGAHDDHVRARTTDNGDGTYTLVWQSERAGKHSVQVSIGDEQILHSPCILELLPAAPALDKTIITGSGLAQAKAGEASVCNVKLLDAFENAIRMTERIRFGIALVASHEKPRRKKRPSDPYVGKWVDNGDNGGHFEMTYTPTRAGELNIFLWYEKPVEGRRRWQRIQLPGSPFTVACEPGQSHAPSCSVGFEWLDSSAEDETMQTVQIEDGAAALPVGAAVYVLPQLFDKFANPVLGDSALFAEVIGPDRASHDLELKRSNRAAASEFEARHELKLAGEYTVHVTVGGVPIRGSPTSFRALAPQVEPVVAPPPVVKKVRMEQAEAPAPAPQGTPQKEDPRLLQEHESVAAAERATVSTPAVAEVGKAKQGQAAYEEEAALAKARADALTIAEREAATLTAAEARALAKAEAERLKAEAERARAEAAAQARAEREAALQAAAAAKAEAERAKAEAVARAKAARDDAEKAKAAEELAKAEAVLRDKAEREAALQAAAAAKAEAERAKAEAAARAKADREAAEAARAEAERAKADAAARAKAELDAIREAHAAAKAEADRQHAEATALAKAAREAAIAEARAEADRAKAELAAQAKAERDAALAEAAEAKRAAEAQAKAERAAKALAEAEERAAAQAAQALADAEKKAEELAQRAAAAAAKAEAALARAQSAAEAKALRDAAAREAAEFKALAEKMRAEALAKSKADQAALREALAAAKAEAEKAAAEAAAQEKAAREAAKQAAAEAVARAEREKAAANAASKAEQEARAQAAAEAAAALEAEERAKKAARALMEAEERVAAEAARALEEAQRKEDEALRREAALARMAAEAEAFERSTTETKAAMEAAAREAAEAKAAADAARAAAIAQDKADRDLAMEDAAAAKASEELAKAEAAAQAKADREDVAEVVAAEERARVEAVAQVKAEREAALRMANEAKSEADRAKAEVAAKTKEDRLIAAEAKAAAERAKMDAAAQVKAEKQAAKGDAAVAKAEAERAKAEAVAQMKAERGSKEKLGRSPSPARSASPPPRGSKQPFSPASSAAGRNDAEFLEDEEEEEEEEDFSDDDDTDSSEDEVVDKSGARRATNSGAASNAEGAGARGKARAAPVSSSAEQSGAKRLPNTGKSAADREEVHETGYASGEEGSASSSSTMMTKVQYGKLLLQQANKKLAEELRQRYQQNENFRKLQAKKFLDGQLRKVQDTHHQMSLMSAAIEKQRALKQEMASGIRNVKSDTRQGLAEAKATHSARARDLVHHAREVHGPNIRESLLSARADNQARAQEVRLEIEECHQMGEAFEVAEVGRKREIRDRVREEIGPESLQASASVVYAERVDTATSVRTMQKHSEQQVKKEREAVAGHREAKKVAVQEAKQGAKHARSGLSTRRKVDADELRRKAVDNKERRSQSSQETQRMKRRAREDVLEARSPPSPTRKLKP